MNQAETARLCRAIAAIAPAQKFDDETPAFWCLLLADVRYMDAQEAVIAIGRRQAWIAPADILAEVRRIRASRLGTADTVLPAADPDDVRAWLRAHRAQLTALADGELVAPAPVVGDPSRVMRAIAGLWARPPRGDRLPPTNGAVRVPESPSGE